MLKLILGYPTVSYTHLDVYKRQADAYAAWQRGSNENSNNGLLREFFPKKTNLAKVTLDKLTEALVLINNRPRKCLGFKTPFDMFKHEIKKLI